MLARGTAGSHVVAVVTYVGCAMHTADVLKTYLHLKGKLHIARIEAMIAGRGHAKTFVLCLSVVSSLAMPNQCQGMCGYNLCSLHAAHVTTQQGMTENQKIC